MTELLHQHGADVGLSDSRGVTALHAAALQGHAAIVDLLLKKGASVDALDEDGWTPLHAAIVRQNEELISLLAGRIAAGQHIVHEMQSLMKIDHKRDLMEEKAEAKATGSTVVAGLRSAVNSNQEQRVKALLENGADIDVEDEIGGSTALTLAAWLRHDHLVRLLLNHGADPNKRGRDGRTALHTAADYGILKLVTLLVENGAEVDAKVHGWTPMPLAAKAWRFEPVDVLEYLVERGANVNAEDYHGRRALHWVAKHGGGECARFLVENGAVVDARDHSGQTPYQWAVKHRHLSIARFLKSMGQK